MGIDRGPDGVGWQVRRIEDAAAAHSAAADQERTQFVVSLDRDEWSLWQQFVRQQDCLMKVPHNDAVTVSPEPPLSGGISSRERTNGLTTFR